MSRVEVNVDRQNILSFFLLSLSLAFKISYHVFCGEKHNLYKEGNRLFFSQNNLLN